MPRKRRPRCRGHSRETESVLSQTRPRPAGAGAAPSVYAWLPLLPQCGDDASQSLARGVGVVHERNPDVVHAGIDPACPRAGEIFSRQQSDTTPFPKGFYRLFASALGRHIEPKEKPALRTAVAVT